MVHLHLTFIYFLFSRFFFCRFFDRFLSAADEIFLHENILVRNAHCPARTWFSFFFLLIPPRCVTKKTINKPSFTILLLHFHPSRCLTSSPNFLNFLLTSFFFFSSSFFLLLFPAVLLHNSFNSFFFFFSFSNFPPHRRTAVVFLPVLPLVNHSFSPYSFSPPPQPHLHLLWARVFIFLVFFCTGWRSAVLLHLLAVLSFFPMYDLAGSISS